MRHLLYCYRSRLDSYLCLKKIQKHLPTLNLVALWQNQIFKNKKKMQKKCFLPTDRLQFFWLCNRKQRPFFKPKASVGQADVQGFEPLLGYNSLCCGVFLVKSRHFRLPLVQTTMAKLAISL